MPSTLDQLKVIIAQWAEPGEPFVTAIPGLRLFRQDQPTELASTQYEPSICVVVQGAKRVALGEDSYEYNARQYLISSIHLPTVAQISQAGPDQPCLGFVLRLDLREVAQLMVDSDLPVPRMQQAGPGMVVGEMTPALLDAFLRLLALLRESADIPILAPMIQREILYRLLIGDQGERLRKIASVGSQSQQIARAIDWLQCNFREPLRIETLAAEAGMSPSTFHHHFRAMTRQSPLQFQKQLRLREARYLMLSEHLDAATSAFQVGYESPSQFSREYSRLFGAPPIRDIERLRQTAAS